MQPFIPGIPQFKLVDNKFESVEVTLTPPPFPDFF